MGSADPPLAVHRLHADSRRQLHRPGTGRREPSVLGDLLAAAAARLAAVHRSVLVRAAVCCQVAQREENMKKSSASKGQSPSELVTRRIAELGDWRGKT